MFEVGILYISALIEQKLNFITKYVLWSSSESSAEQPGIQKPLWI